MDMNLLIVDFWVGILIRMFWFLKGLKELLFLFCVNDVIGWWD